MQVRRTSVLTRRRRFVSFRPLVIEPARWRHQRTSTKPKLLARKLDARRITSIALLAAGGVLCAYVAGSYIWMYAAQKKLLYDWKTQKAASEVLTKLSIPRIGLNVVVLEGTSPHSLLLGPGHMTGSATPGAVGNAVIAGHRDTFFRHVHSLRSGDDIYVLRSGKRFHYTVVKRRVVQPTDLSVVRPTRDSELTLITCYPTHAIGPAPERLIVRAKLSSRSH
ncbi:MAG TPA: class D sortase [Terriglobales bacterium]|nr:class D sortase [Terriglobales bacterium]